MLKWILIILALVGLDQVSKALVVANFAAEGDTLAVIQDFFHITYVRNSGAVFGLLLAYGVTWPNNKLILIFFPVPIKAKWFVLIYGVAELIFGVTGAMPQVAHYAHLGGLFFGAGLLWRWGWRPGMTWK